MINVANINHQASKIMFNGWPVWVRLNMSVINMVLLGGCWFEICDQRMHYPVCAAWRSFNLSLAEIKLYTQRGDADRWLGIHHRWSNDVSTRLSWYMMTLSYESFLHCWTFVSGIHLSPDKWPVGFHFVSLKKLSSKYSARWVTMTSKWRRCNEAIIWSHSQSSLILAVSMENNVKSIHFLSRKSL